MGYDPAAVVRAVSRILSSEPGRSLTSIATDLGIDRHTIARDLKRVNGMTFRQLQTQFMSGALDRLLTEKPMMKKEIADHLGLPSARALRAWIERLKARAKGVRVAPKPSQVRPRRRAGRG